LNEERLDRAERWFDRWEDWAVLVGRVTPVVRSFVSIPAGVFQTPFTRYTVLTAIGSAIWCFAWAGAGWALGASWDGVHKGFRYVDYVVVVGIALLAGYIVLRRVRSITMARRASDSSH
jgi:membrane protein DedA with SNARE-associated domain